MNSVEFQAFLRVRSRLKQLTEGLKDVFLQSKLRMPRDGGHTLVLSVGVTSSTCSDVAAILLHPDARTTALPLDRSLFAWDSLSQSVARALGNFRSVLSNLKVSITVCGNSLAMTLHSDDSNLYNV